MKVLHVTPSISPVRGGTSRATLDMVLALRKNDISVEIATTNDHGENTLFVPVGQRTHYEGIPVWFFPKLPFGFSNALNEFNFSLSLTRWLWENIDKYDLLHIHALFSYPSTMAMILARIRKIPYVISPHGLLCCWPLQQSALRKKIFMKLFEHSNLSHSSALHLTSLKEEKEVSTLNLNSTSFVLPLGLNFTDLISEASQQLRQKFRIEDNAPIVLFMGRLHPVKGLDYLIPALGRLKHYQFHFILAGSGEANYEFEVDALIEAAGIKERTYRPGFVSGREKDILLQGSSFFTLTSRSESFSVAVIEAWAAGLPVLLTPGIALASVAIEQQLGYVVDLNVDAIYNALLKFFENREDCSKIGQRAKKFVLKNYTWEKNAEGLISAYQKVLNTSSITRRPRSDHSFSSYLQ